jgi:hypothetical protein
VSVEVRRAGTLAGIERPMLMLRDRLDEVTPTVGFTGHETGKKADDLAQRKKFYALVGGEPRDDRIEAALSCMARLSSWTWFIGAPVLYPAHVRPCLTPGCYALKRRKCDAVG